VLGGELHLFDAEGFFAEVIYPVRMALDDRQLAPLRTLFARYDLEARGASFAEVEAEVQAFDRRACVAYRDTGPAVLSWPDCPADRCPVYASCPHPRLVFVAGRNPQTGEEVGGRLEENYLGGSALAQAAELVMERFVQKEPAFAVGNLIDDLRSWLQVRAFPGSPAGQALGLMWRLVHRGFVVGRADVFGYSGFLMPGEARDLHREANELPVGAMSPEKVKRAVAGLVEGARAASERGRGLLHGLF
jgi:hypothetical protein